MTEESLHCFEIGPDTIVESTAEKAIAWASREFGLPVEDMDPCVPVSDDKEISITLEDAPDPMTCECATWVRDSRQGKPISDLRNGHHRNCEHGRPTKTAGTWARENGIGLLCSTEI